MRLIKFIVVDAAVGYGINYLSKKGDNGHSIIDDIAENAPDLFDRAKKFLTTTAEKLRHDSDFSLE